MGHPCPSPPPSSPPLSNKRGGGEREGRAEEGGGRFFRILARAEGAQKEVGRVGVKVYRSGGVVWRLEGGMHVCI